MHFQNRMNPVTTNEKRLVVTGFSRWEGTADSQYRMNPALRLVHCIRDLAYGDEQRKQDLNQMVKSNDPAMRKLLVDSFWRDP